MPSQGHWLPGVVSEKTGMPGALVVHLARMSRSVSPDGTANLTDGKTKKDPAIPILNGFPATKMADSPPGKKDSPHGPNMKEAGSAMNMLQRALMLMTISRRCATENGAKTRPDTAPSASGTAAPNLNKNLNGWMPMTETNHDEYTPRRTLSAGKSV